MKYFLHFFFICVLSSSILASDELTVTATGHPDYSPVISYEKNSNTLTGSMVKRLEAALEKLGLKLKVVYVGSWARAQEEVRMGRIDILLPPYRTDERLSWMHFQERPVMMDETAVFVKKNKVLNFNQNDDLLKYKGVAIINDSFGDEFDEFDRKKLKLKRLASTEQCFRFLLKDRADYLIAGLHAGNRVLEKMQATKEFEVLPRRVIVTGMYAGISKKSKIFINRPELIKNLEIELHRTK